MNQAMRWGAAILIVSAVTVGVDCLAVTRTALHDAIFNSDVVQPFLVVQSFLSDPRSLFTWYHSPAIFAVPDWLIALVLIALHLPERAMPFAYAVIVVLGFSALTGAVARTTGAARSMLHGTIAGATVFALAWLLSVTSVRTVPLLSFVTLPAFHGGAVLGSIYGAWLTASVVAERSIRGQFVHRFAIAALGFSDALSVAWVTLPMVAGVLLTPTPAGVWRRLGSVLPLATAGLIGACLGILLSLANPANAAYFGRTVRPGLALQYLGDFISSNLGDPWFAGLVVLTTAAIVSGAAIAVRPTRPPAAVGAVAVYIATSIVLAIVFPVVSGRYIAADQWRYLGVVPLLGLLWLALLLCRFRRILIGVAGLAAVIGVVVPAWANPFESAWTAGQSGLVACLGTNGLRDGYGDYWSAKQTIFLSGRSIHVAQLEGAQEMRFNFDESWFVKRADGQEFKPDFIVVDRLDAKLLSARFGKPDSVVDCAGSVIWRYQHDIRD